MGCVKSSNVVNDQETACFRVPAHNRPNRLRKPRPWRHNRPITGEQLTNMRNMFWHNAPHFGGRQEIWSALRAAAESDLPYAQAIIDNNGIRVENPYMTVCYDEGGARYELPLYVLAEPTNLEGSVRRPFVVNRPNIIEETLRRR
ncbi:hypothetical protein Ccrd_008560 [Cynara cardunculus var. scolymus]|uniref:DC-UbP/UBTD2 N-terminal domain-containing protein n=2 Tax=Cynara cardunculus var. scolymus TaxID=59895 RepID=A0A118JT92_CYNCS|nr:hypothetical protein Ccrd_008560 [Cynara cardunculus var. scolymus]